MTAIVSLRDGVTEVDLVPELGGAISRLSYTGIDLLRPAPPRADWDSPRRLGMFAMVPYSNRVRNGTFTHNGQTYRMAKNMPDQPHTIHGDGWQKPWKVDIAGQTRALLSFHHDGRAGWPFAYRAELHYQLARGELTIDLSLENFEDFAVPVGFGLHPYFPRAGAILQTRTERVWLSDETSMPVRATKVPAEWDFSSGRSLDGVTVDNCFGGWGGEAEISWPEHRLTMTMSADPVFSHCVIYVPAGQDFFCVEPATNANDGVNLRTAGEAQSGIIDLAPGGILTGQVRFAVTTI